MGVYFIDAAMATHSGPDPRLKPHSSDSTMSAWMLPPADTANRSGPTSRASIGPLRPMRASITVTAAEAASSTVDHRTATTMRGRTVSGIQAIANHGAYQYESTATSPGT